MPETKYAYWKSVWSTGESGLTGWPGINARWKPGPTMSPVDLGKRSGFPVWSQCQWLQTMLLILLGSKPPSVKTSLMVFSTFKAGIFSGLMFTNAAGERFHQSFLQPLSNNMFFPSCLFCTRKAKSGKFNVSCPLSTGWIIVHDGTTSWVVVSIMWTSTTESDWGKLNGALSAIFFFGFQCCSANEYMWPEGIKKKYVWMRCRRGLSFLSSLFSDFVRALTVRKDLSYSETSGRLLRIHRSCNPSEAGFDGDGWDKDLDLSIHRLNSLHSLKPLEFTTCTHG